ncbi:MAG: hypothetical protein PHC41_14495 [Lachnospiraceae bacterium]|jgi:hypothetical protein|nr:hypothetical protein [Lachnospiraceae bacterium]MDD3617415.1 hypothetical protein [Lachnospiraceae bacterium]
MIECRNKDWGRDAGNREHQSHAAKAAGTEMDRGVGRVRNEKSCVNGAADSEANP